MPWVTTEIRQDRGRTIIVPTSKETNKQTSSVRLHSKQRIIMIKRLEEQKEGRGGNEEKKEEGERPNMIFLRAE